MQLEKVKDLLLLADTDQRDHFPLTGHSPKIESEKHFILVSPQLSTWQLNQLFSNAIHYIITCSAYTSKGLRTQ